jgi:hypothetical protein
MLRVNAGVHSRTDPRQRDRRLNNLQGRAPLPPKASAFS